MKKIALYFFVLTLLMSCNSKIGMNKTSEDFNCEASRISQEELAQMLNSKDLDKIQFVDIRSPHAYSISHLHNAINVPVDNFFDDNRFEEINPDKMVVIYGENASQPRLMTLLSGHFDYGTFYFAGGGYDYIQQKIIQGKDSIDLAYDDEKPMVNFKEKVEEMKAKAGVEAKDVVDKTPKKTIQPIAPRKKKAVSGGCG